MELQRGKSILLILFLSIEISIGAPSPMSNRETEDIDDVLEFFPDCRNDGLNLRWGHAVNSWSQLNRTLLAENETRIHMIEGDVIIRQRPQSTNICQIDEVPVMGHPPATDSDLTFENWLTTINAFRGADPKIVLRVGAKADFKSLQATKASLKILQRYRSSLSIPIWLNADICHGPGGGGSAIPVDADQFLRWCTDYGPGLTLSLGWTTTPTIDQFRCSKGYGWSEILDIYRRILPFIRETASSGRLPRITFAVRAALVKASMDRLLWLLNACVAAAGGDDRLRNKFSITLWTSASADRLTRDDYLSITYLRLTAGKNRIFIDLPATDVGCLEELNPTRPTSIGETKSIDFDQWEIIDESGIIKSESLGIAFLGNTTTTLKSIGNFKSLIGRFVLIPSLSNVESPPRESISIWIVVEGGRVLWTVEFSFTPCFDIGSVENYECIRLRKNQDQESYSFSINISGREIILEWKSEEGSRFQLETRPSPHSPTCDVRLNCTTSETPIPAGDQGSIRKILNSDLIDYRFAIGKIGLGDLILEKLTVTA